MFKLYHFRNKRLCKLCELSVFSDKNLNVHKSTNAAKLGMFLNLLLHCTDDASVPKFSKRNLAPCI